MPTIADIQKQYFRKLDHLDLELLLAHTLKKPREFVLAHPEYALPTTHNRRLTTLIRRRLKHEPIAYILGHKEFFGLDFKVTKDTLIPRPETELLVELAIRELTTDNQQPTTVVDVGTGSGNIIISIAKNQKLKTVNYYAIDISKKALLIAKQNAKKHKVEIKFIHGNLLEPIIGNWIRQPAEEIGNSKIIILANLPYLSKEIYSAALPDVKKYEPRSALFSPKEGLDHYEKLLKQINHLLQVTGYQLLVTIFLEISPEHKSKLPKMIRKILPRARTSFQKDLAGKWRICRIET